EGCDAVYVRVPEPARGRQGAMAARYAFRTFILSATERVSNRRFRALTDRFEKTEFDRTEVRRERRNKKGRHRHAQRNVSFAVRRFDRAHSDYEKSLFRLNQARKMPPRTIGHLGEKRHAIRELDGQTR